MKNVTLTEARTHLGKLVEQAASGETVCITRRGKPVTQLTAIDAPRKKIDIEILRRVTAGMTRQSESAGDFVRRMRDEDRY